MKILVTCNYDWEHQNEFEDEKTSRAWMVAHSTGLDPEFQDDSGDPFVGHDEFRVWEFVGDATIKVPKKVETTVDIVWYKDKKGKKK